MPRYTVTASVTVDVEMSIEAPSEQAARSIFDDQLVMTASLVGTSIEEYDVSEDSISDVANLSIIEEG